MFSYLNNSIGDLPTVNVADFVMYNHSTPLNHYDYQDDSEFNLRYWKNDKFVTEDSGPLFLYICGEYTCSVREDRLFPFMVGASYGAELYALEHRFYGESVPDMSLELSNLRYLSTE